MDSASQWLDVLEWDSNFWGFRIARVCGTTLNSERASEIDAICLQERITCLFLLAELEDSDTTRTAEEFGFHFADVRMTFRARASIATVPRPDAVDSTIVIRECRDEDRDALRRIAAISHKNTRFFYDRNFPRDRCQALYETWITRSCDGYADRVLVATDAGRAVGYVTCHLPRYPGNAGQIGLVGVDDDDRGRGIGSSLVTDALRWFGEAGTEEVTVVTQGRNIGAQRLYKRTGFDIDFVQLWYHKWYLPPSRGEEARGGGDA